MNLYSNTPDTQNGVTSAHVFLGQQTGYIHVYGHKGGGNGFLKCYQDFCRTQGCPSSLRRDNAQESKSSKVLGFNPEFLIKDEWSEPVNQQQNPVETGGIRWLKMSTSLLLDCTGAPNWSWLLVLRQLAQIHNLSWSQNLEGIPVTKGDGITTDISCLLQFVFWERVLFLDHEGSFPDSRERAGYFCGISENVGDALTYLIYEDQLHNALSRSIVRPFTKNKRVRWNPISIKDKLTYKAWDKP